MLQFGKYLLVQPLGKGGMAQVWLAHKPTVAGAVKVCAIKFPRDIFSDDENEREALFREARVAMLLSHSNIVQVNDLGNVGVLPYVELERIDGIDLAALCEQMRLFGMPFSFSLAAYILQEILEALAYAHTFSIDGVPQRIVHRDISPHNVIVSTAGEVKLMDFGIAAAVSEHTSGNHARGKLRYMAPEHLAARATQQSDLFAAGAIFWELLEGKKFRHDTPFDDMRVAVLRHDVPKLTRTDVPHELARLCRAMLEGDLRKRVATADEALKLLRLWSGSTSERAGLRALLARHNVSRRSGMTQADIVLPAWLSAALNEINLQGAAAASEPPVVAVGSAPGNAGIPTEREDDAPTSLRKRSSPGVPAPAAAAGGPAASERTPVLATQPAVPKIDRTQRFGSQAGGAVSSVGPVTEPDRQAIESPVPVVGSRISSDAETATATDPEEAPRRRRRLAVAAAAAGSILLGAAVTYGAFVFMRGPARGEGDAVALLDGPQQGSPEAPSIGAASEAPEPLPSDEVVSGSIQSPPTPAFAALAPVAAVTSSAPDSAVPAATAPIAPTAAPSEPDVVSDSPAPTERSSEATPARRSPPASPTKAKRVEVTVRVRLMLVDYAELKLGGKTIVVEPSADLKIPAGKHAVKWRLDPSEPWRSSSSATLGEGLTHVVRIGRDGPKFASSPETKP